ncbi:MAG: hypothetical protein U0X20_28755 [Caldilineaceae bacterium]
MRCLLLSVCLLAAVFTVAACGGSSTPEATPVPAEQAAGTLGQPPTATFVAEALVSAATVEDTAAGSITAETDTGTPTATPGLALAAPSELLDSYRIAATYIITSQLPDGQRRIDSTQLQGAWRRTEGPQGYDAAFALANVSGSRRQELNFVAVGDAAAIQSDGAWSTIARDATLSYGDPDQLLSMPFITHVNRGEDLGQETAAGVTVTHYRLTDPAIFAEAVGDSLPLADGTVKNVQLEGWVAQAGYVVKYLLQASLENAQILDDSGSLVQVQQEVSASYALSDLDSVESIEWPADAQPPNTITVPGFVPNTFPLPEGAKVIPRLGMLELRTADSESDVAAFYRAHLPELGWSFDGEQGFYSAEKDGQRITLTILPDEATRETVVRVFAAGD